MCVFNFNQLFSCFTPLSKRKESPLLVLTCTHVCICVSGCVCIACVFLPVYVYLCRYMYICMCSGVHRSEWDTEHDLLYHFLLQSLETGSLTETSLGASTP